MADTTAPTRVPKYISNDSSLGGDEFHDALETLSKRASSLLSYGSGRSTGGGAAGSTIAPSPAAAELIAVLASTGSGRKIDVGSTMEEFGSTTADEGPPGGSLGLETFYSFPNTGPESIYNTAVGGMGNPFGPPPDEGDKGGLRQWPPPNDQQPKKIVLDISSAETTPNTTPSGGRGKGDGSGVALWGTQSPSPPPPPVPPRKSSVNTNPFATTTTTEAFIAITTATASTTTTTTAVTAATSCSSNPFAAGSTTGNPFANVAGEPPPGGVVVGRSPVSSLLSSSVGPAPASATPAQTPAAALSMGSIDKARPPPLPPRRPVMQSATAISSSSSSSSSLHQQRGEQCATPPPCPPRPNVAVERDSSGSSGSAAMDTTDGVGVGVGADAGDRVQTNESVELSSACDAAIMVGVARVGGAKENGGQYMVVNKDTGQIFDMRELEQHLPPEEYNLLPSRADLIALERRRSVMNGSGAPKPPGRPLSLGRPLSPLPRPSISSVAASMAAGMGAAVGNASSRKERARSLGNKVRKGFEKAKTAAGAAASVAGGVGGSSGGGATAAAACGDAAATDRGDKKATSGGSGGGSGGIGAAARSALSGIRVSLKGKEASESLAGLMLLQELKSHNGPIWTAAFNHSGKFLATTGQDMKILLHHVGDVTQDPYADYTSGGSGNSNSGEGGGGGRASEDKPGAADGNQGRSGKSSSPKGTDSETNGLRAGASAPRPPVHPGNGGGRDEKSTTTGAPIGAGRGGREATEGGTSDAKEGISGDKRESSRRSSGVPLFMGLEPCQVWEAHRADVVALSWSRNDFLLSASLDKTVRLWHTTQPGCLHFFKHNDIVTAVDFHPLLEHFFLSGCFDKKVRVWNIRDGHVQLWQQAPDMVTAAKFSLDGHMIVAGLYMGQVLFYQTEGMRYFTQIECRNRRGPQKRGRKVTGFAFNSTAVGCDSGGDGGGASRRASGANGRACKSPSTSPGGGRRCSEGSRRGEGGMGAGAGGVRGGGGGPGNHIPEQLLVTTNDSRVRLYNTDDFGMNAKYKGLSNDTLQITASFSEDGKQIISGSENGKVYVWGTGVVTKPTTSNLAGAPDMVTSSPSRPGSPVSTTQKDTNRCHESFEASHGDPAIVTHALFVPESTARACVTAVRGALNKEVADAGGYCGCMILSTDYDGCVRVYCKSGVLLS